MRCIGCDSRLNDMEAVRKYGETEEYVELCSNCYSVSKDAVEENAYLWSKKEKDNE